MISLKRIFVLLNIRFTELYSTDVVWDLGGNVDGGVVMDAEDVVVVDLVVGVHVAMVAGVVVDSVAALVIDEVVLFSVCR